MVSKAREDFPDPETPVTTVSALCGISKSMFFRLWTRAPRTTMLWFKDSGMGEYTTTLAPKIETHSDGRPTDDSASVAESFNYIQVGPWLARVGTRRDGKTRA